MSKPVEFPVRATTRKCPICSRPTLPEFKPFCSKRCADEDLGRWLTGSYAVPVTEENERPGDDEDERVR